MIRTGRTAVAPGDLDDVLERAIDLPTVDPAGPIGAGPERFDRRTYEERFAELAFGLGVVPRKQRRDDPWWETTGGMLIVIVIALALVFLLASAH